MCFILFGILFKFDIFIYGCILCYPMGIVHFVIVVKKIKTDYPDKKDYMTIKNSMGLYYFGLNFFEYYNCVILA